MNPESVIQHHLDLCDQVYTVLNEENRILRSTGQVPESVFLERKKALLPQLTESVDALKIIRESQPQLGPKIQELIQAGQKKLMKIFLLDRENEQLLLKASMPKTMTRNALPNLRSTGLYESISKQHPESGGLQHRG